MTTHPSSCTAHPIEPYARALEIEHEEALLGPKARPLAGLLAHQARASALTGRVVIVRHAGPAEPFRSQ